AVAEFPFAGDRQAGAVAGFEGGAVFHHEHPFAGEQQRDVAVAEIEIDALVEADIGEIEGDVPGDVLELEVFEVVISTAGQGRARGVVHNLRDHEESLEVIDAGGRGGGERVGVR